MITAFAELVTAKCQHTLPQQHEFKGMRWHSLKGFASETDKTSHLLFYSIIIETVKTFLP